ncbi:hypothetical protein C100_06115 [Sphingobium sp. C100]|nr:hypothetical protein C100_06115 [Sphingobium sp. C100]
MMMERCNCKSCQMGFLLLFVFHLANHLNHILLFFWII